MRPVEASDRARVRGAMFVYYKVASEQVGQLRQAFERAAAAPFPAFPSIRRVELMRRSSDADSSGREAGDRQTWMEIYWFDQQPGTEFQSPDLKALQQTIEAVAREAGIISLVDGTRHYEAFELCA